LEEVVQVEVEVEVQRGDKDGETKDERSEVELVERGLTTDQAGQGRPNPSGGSRLETSRRR
jgi:hypothetical protein